jgi:hypothetical protein
MKAIKQTHTNTTGKLLLNSKTISKMDVFERNRYETMKGYMFSLRGKARDRTILLHYREWNRIIWLDEERKCARDMLGNNNYERKKAYYEDEQDEHNQDYTSYLQLTPGQELSIMKNVSYCNDVGNALKHVTNDMDTDSENILAGAFNEINSDSDSDQDDSSSKVANHPFVRHANMRFVDEILDDDIYVDENDEERSGQNNVNMINQETDEELNVRVDNYLNERNLSSDKALAVSIMRDHFNQLRRGTDEGYEPPVLLVTGGPGVGKSFLVDVIDGVSKILRVGKQLRMALFGSAAVNIDGSSLMALMDIPTEHKGVQQRVTPWKEENCSSLKGCTIWMEYRLLL